MGKSDILYRGITYRLNLRQRNREEPGYQKWIRENMYRDGEKCFLDTIPLLVYGIVRKGSCGDRLLELYKRAIKGEQDYFAYSVYSDSGFLENFGWREKQLVRAGIGCILAMREKEQENHWLFLEFMELLEQSFSYIVEVWEELREQKTLTCSLRYLTEKIGAYAGSPLELASLVIIACVLAEKEGVSIEEDFEQLVIFQALEDLTAHLLEKNTITSAWGESCQEENLRLLKKIQGLCYEIGLLKKQYGILETAYLAERQKAEDHAREEKYCEAYGENIGGAYSVEKIKILMAEVTRLRYNEAVLRRNEQCEKTISL